MQKISRQKTVNGTRIPGIIKNVQYHFVHLDVYEDGMVNCWELVDLEGLRHKLDVNWLVPSVPNRENLSIFGLGSYKIQSAQWHFDKNSYYEYIKNTIKALNPNLNNIYAISKEEQQLWEKRRVSFSPQAKDYYVKNELLYQTVEGNSFTIFMKHEAQYYLVKMVVYKDGRVTCYHPDFEMNYQMEDVRELFRNGTFFTSFKGPIQVIIGRFAEVTLGKVIYSTDSEEKYKELTDLHAKLNGEKTSLEKCREAYYSYLEYPSEYTRERLKRLYELIPEHERQYLGDMDSRDSDYRRIIYHPEDKREV